MGYQDEERRWKRMQEMLLAEAGGKAVRAGVSQRTLFGIPSTVEQAIERIVAEDEEERRAKRGRKDPLATAPPPHSATDGNAQLVERAERAARESGLSLQRDERGLALSDGAMTLRGDFSRMKQRIRPGNLSRELLVKAARVKGAQPGGLLAVDATAGLGQDSLLLAAAGFDVLLYERNPVIAALLADAIAQAADDPQLAQAAARMNLRFGDGAEGLRQLEASPAVVLLDPMFPGRAKSAAVKKKLQLMQRLEQPCEDEDALFDAALAARPRKIVVKRPAKGPHLANRKPDYSLDGKAVRFDCYSLIW